jgi:hypothetical protein
MCEDPSKAACWELALQSNAGPVQITIVAGLKPMLMRTAF